VLIPLNKPLGRAHLREDYMGWKLGINANYE